MYNEKKNRSYLPLGRVLVLEPALSMLSLSLLPMLTSLGLDVVSVTLDSLTPQQWTSSDIVVTNIANPRCLSAWLVWKSLPVMGLRPNAGVATRVAYLDAGAIDCMSLPFEREEFLARIRVQLRSCGISRSLSVEQDDLLLDIEERKVFVQNQEVSLTHMEFNLLTYLIRQFPRICHHDELLRQVWGRRSQAQSTRTVNTHINQLRSKLGRERIRCKHKVGYGYHVMS